MKVHAHPASFDKLRMRKNLGGTKNPPHPELVEGRTVLVQFSAVVRVRRHLFAANILLEQ
jgi:hypothetical protein